MKIRRYDPSDLETLNSWLLARGLEAMRHDEVPLTGFVVSGLEDLAAGFMRVVEGGMVLFDGLVSNPKATLYSRHLAIELLTGEILKEAKRKRFNKMVCYSVDGGTLKRAVQHGFKKLPHTVMAVDLNLLSLGVN